MSPYVLSQPMRSIIKKRIEEVRCYSLEREAAVEARRLERLQFENRRDRRAEWKRSQRGENWPWITPIKDTEGDAAF